MKKRPTNRAAVYMLASLICYVVFCYIAFSGTWDSGAMKIFMALIAVSGVLFVYFCGRLSFAPVYLQSPQSQDSADTLISNYSSRESGA